jgi:hypothetical protein
MADEVFVTSEDQDLFQLSNGRYIMDNDCFEWRGPQAGKGAAPNE